MEPVYMKATISAGWVCALTVVALVGHLTFSGSLLLATLAVVPPIVLMRYWKAPVETLSQSIQGVLR